jgi:hypothetical protein
LPEESFALTPRFRERPGQAPYVEREKIDEHCGSTAHSQAYTSVK